jgi:hypothetical protein
MMHAIISNEPLGKKTPEKAEVHGKFVGHPVAYVVSAAPHSNFGKDRSYCLCHPSSHNIRLDHLPNTSSLACYPSEVENAVIQVRTSIPSISIQS